MPMTRTSVASPTRSELAEAWGEAAAWQGLTQAGGIPLAAAAAGMVRPGRGGRPRLGTRPLHDQPYTTDEAAVRARADFLAEQPRNDDLFAPAVPVAEDAPAIDQLIGLSGRDPSWHPPG